MKNTSRLMDRPIKKSAKKPAKKERSWLAKLLLEGADPKKLLLDELDKFL